MTEVVHSAQMFVQSNFPLLQLQLTDILDIAILSFVIYKLLWMLRKTSSGRVLRGVLILLLGGRTGRDGIGGATGSSKEHNENSLEECGSEVQKGNAPEERKLQRLFRSPM